MATASRGPADMDTRAAAAYLGLELRTLEDWRSKLTGPRFVRVSTRAVRYRRSDLDAWLDSQTVKTTHT